MVDAVATRIAPSALALLQNAPSSSSPAEDGRGTSPAAMAPAAPDQSDAVILDLSEQAQAVLSGANAGDQTTASANTDDPPGLTRVEKRFKLMTEYTALQQELVWLSDRAAAHALDEMFQGAAAAQDESGAADKRAQFDRDMQRREELMPRYAELVRMLEAPPGQDS
ncbi:hypothetical protein QO058_05390 [Bosea vestrisii]|uniref:hypothetical protein n=1 Tax=Bosea vestrisii TaxID=151416 RepID=UPI0024DF9AE4|nr:hypothetical protein [Bosea vestrisii]WID97689.1 hypothetical protein QO058_05390 [Bosea vestrisii]